MTELKSHLCWLYFYSFNDYLMKNGGKPEYPEKTPDDELQKMPHTKVRKIHPKARLEPTL